MVIRHNPHAILWFISLARIAYEIQRINYRVRDLSSMLNFCIKPPLIDVLLPNEEQEHGWSRPRTLSDSTRPWIYPSIHKPVNESPPKGEAKGAQRPLVPNLPIKEAHLKAATDGACLQTANRRDTQPAHTRQHFKLLSGQLRHVKLTHRHGRENTPAYRLCGAPDLVGPLSA